MSIIYNVLSIATPTGYLLINCAWNWGKGLGSASRVLGSFVSQGIYLMPPLILFQLSALFPKSTQTTISSVLPQNRDHQYKPFYRQGWFFPFNTSLLIKQFHLFKGSVLTVSWPNRDWELLGMFWSGSYHFDKVLPFGLCSAPFNYNQLSDAIEWILQNKCAISLYVTSWMTSL